MGKYDNLDDLLAAALEGEPAAEQELVRILRAKFAARALGRKDVQRKVLEWETINGERPTGAEARLAQRTVGKTMLKYFDAWAKDPVRFRRDAERISARAREVGTTQAVNDLAHQLSQAAHSAASGFWTTARKAIERNIRLLRAEGRVEEVVTVDVPSALYARVADLLEQAPGFRGWSGPPAGPAAEPRVAVLAGPDLRLPSKGIPKDHKSLIGKPGTVYPHLEEGVDLGIAFARLGGLADDLPPSVIPNAVHRIEWIVPRRIGARASGVASFKVPQAVWRQATLAFLDEVTVPVPRSVLLDALLRRVQQVTGLRNQTAI